MLRSNKIFGRIREKEMTIGKVAVAVGMKSQTLSNKIKGKSRIYHDEIMAISKVLDLTDAEIISFFYPEVSKIDTTAPPGQSA